MLKEFLKENEENAISFVTIFVIIICIILIIVIFVINFLNNNGKNESINTISSSNYVENMTNEYGNIVKNVLNTRNTEKLYKNLDNEYLFENNLNSENLKDFLLENNYIGNSITIISSDVFNEDDVYIYRYYYKNYSDYKYVNVIEKKPGEYTISLEQDIGNISVSDVTYTGSIDNVVFNLSIIEKNEDSIKFMVKVSNESDYEVFVDFNDINTFSLIDSEDNLYKESGIVAQNLEKLSSNSTISKELFFNISNDDFKKCIGVQVFNIEINGEYKDLFIEF